MFYVYFKYKLLNWWMKLLIETYISRIQSTIVEGYFSNQYIYLYFSFETIITENNILNIMNASPKAQNIISNKYF